MPAKSQWLANLPEIIRELELVQTPVVDRACVETVFGVGRRRAIQLMHEFGGYQAGKTFLLDRLALIGKLGAMVGGEGFYYESRRRQRLGRQLQSLAEVVKARRVVVAVGRGGWETTVSTLPEGVVASAGRLVVEFSSREELATRLFAVVQALANDYESFEVY
jgi:hypothetical protein